MGVIIGLLSKIKIFYKITTIFTGISMLYFIAETLSEYWIKWNDMVMRFGDVNSLFYIFLFFVIINVFITLPKIIEKILIYFKTTLLQTLIINIISRVTLSLAMFLFTYITNLLLTIKPNSYGQLITLNLLENTIIMGKYFNKEEKVEWLNEIINTNFKDIPEHLIKNLNLENIPWDTITCKVDLINYLIMKLLIIQSNYQKQIDNSIIHKIGDMITHHPYIILAFVTGGALLGYIYKDAIITMIKSLGENLLQFIRIQKEKAAQEYVGLENQKIIASQLETIHNIIPKLNPLDQQEAYLNVIKTLNNMKDYLESMTNEVIKNSNQINQQQQHIDFIINFILTKMNETVNDDLL